MSLVIRPANAADAPLIIELLKKSLGESTIPKSEKLWNWKHSANPFGASEILVAEEGNTLVGVRAFMHWKWNWKGRQYQAVRAVDTATHPAFQGKGIFKKLTLQLADDCKQKGIDFIFNTPNANSLPGYLKMGWVAHGKLAIKFRVLRPVVLAYAMVLDKKKYSNRTADPSPDQDWDNEILRLASAAPVNNNRLSTPVSPQYFSWRYSSNPLFKYNYFTDGKNVLVISRIKQQAFSRELRIVECLPLQEGRQWLQSRSYIRKALLTFCKAHDIDVISISGEQYLIYREFFGWLGLLPPLPVGPILTVKDLNMNENFSLLLTRSNWGYSLGDLELF